MLPPRVLGPRPPSRPPPPRVLGPRPPIGPPPPAAWHAFAARLGQQPPPPTEPLPPPPPPPEAWHEAEAAWWWHSQPPPEARWHSQPPPPTTPPPSRPSCDGSAPPANKRPRTQQLPLDPEAMAALVAEGSVAADASAAAGAEVDDDAVVAKGLAAEAAALPATGAEEVAEAAIASARAPAAQAADAAAAADEEPAVDAQLLQAAVDLDETWTSQLLQAAVDHAFIESDRALRASRDANHLLIVARIARDRALAAERAALEPALSEMEAAIRQAVEDAEISFLHAVGVPAFHDQAEADQKVIGIVFCKYTGLCDVLSPSFGSEARAVTHWSGSSYRHMSYSSVKKAVALAEPMDCVSDDRGLRSPTFVTFDMLEPAVDIMLDAAVLGDGRTVHAMVADWECPSEAYTTCLRLPFVLGSLVVISAWESLAVDCRSRCSAGYVLDFWRDLRHQVAAAPNGEAHHPPLAAAPHDDRPTDLFSANMFLTMANQLRQWSPMIAAGHEGNRELLATFTSWLDACAESLTREKFLAWGWQRRASRGGFMKLRGLHSVFRSAMCLINSATVFTSWPSTGHENAKEYILGIMR
ncbi:unnamed protein product [Prorocentrum cordatum]|uniref:Uncharacterized protein n=1 Tax=Prorocentrum cordatum TaxID=2364126 RepID=A0ABN9UVM1_9DINO|nr:unnamed protein product [Polarella glacialis]